jgi:hypothetical protein
VAPGWPASGGPAKFWPTAGRGRPGTGGGGSLGTDSRARSEWGGGRRGAAPAARPGGRCDLPAPARAAQERLANGAASFGGCKGRWGRACFGAQPAGGGSSAGAAAMAPAGVQASGREVVRKGEGNGLVYRRPTSMPVTKGPTAHA